MDLTKLKSIRKSQKITILKLAQLTNLSRQTIALIESGKQNTSTQTLSSILAALNTDCHFVPNDLLNITIKDLLSDH